MHGTFRVLILINIFFATYIKNMNNFDALFVPENNFLNVLILEVITVVCDNYV